MILLLLSFIILANGVSYLSEILKKDKKYLKLITGFISLVIFIFILFPQDQDTSSIMGWMIITGLSLSSILISVFSIFEVTNEFVLMKVYSILFAVIIGIYNFCISSFISRGYDHSEAVIAHIIYGLIMFFISIAVNLIAVSSLKIE
jgi:hypothetical protein